MFSTYNYNIIHKPDDECRHHKVYHTFSIYGQSSTGQICILESTVLIANDVNHRKRKKVLLFSNVYKT